MIFNKLRFLKKSSVTRNVSRKFMEFLVISMVRMLFSYEDLYGIVPEIAVFSLNTCFYSMDALDHITDHVSLLSVYTQI